MGIFAYQIEGNRIAIHTDEPKVMTMEEFESFKKIEVLRNKKNSLAKAKESIESELLEVEQELSELTNVGESFESVQEQPEVQEVVEEEKPSEEVVVQEQPIQSVPIYSVPLRKKI